MFQSTLYARGSFVFVHFQAEGSIAFERLLLEGVPAGPAADEPRTRDGAHQ